MTSAVGLHNAIIPAIAFGCSVSNDSSDITVFPDRIIQLLEVDCIDSFSKNKTVCCGVKRPTRSL